MNWKRGFARIYIVVWAIAAVGGAYIAAQDSQNMGREREQVRSYLKEQNVTMKDLESWIYSRAHPDSTTSWVPDGAEPDVEANRRTDEILEIVSSERYKHPAIAQAKILATWLAICGAIPAVALAVGAWIIKGFEPK
jgi:hypothetical protein